MPSQTATATITPTTPKTKKAVTPAQYKLTPRSAAKIKPRGWQAGKTSTTKTLFEDTTTQSTTPDFFVARQNIKKLTIYSTPAEEEEEEERLDQRHKPSSTHRESPPSPIHSKESVGTPFSESVIRPKPLRAKVDGFSELPKLTKENYFTDPDIATLSTMPSEQLSAIDRFTVGLKDVGNVMFFNKTDVRGLDLDKIVHFQPGEIVVYPDDVDKPVIGQELNKAARVTLQRLWPIDKTTGKRKNDEQSLLRYEAKIKKSTTKLGARFVRYDKNNGDWIFEVDHFSRYGIIDDTDDEEDEEIQPAPPQKTVKPHITIPQPHATTTPSPSKRFRIDESESDESSHDEQQQPEEVTSLSNL